MHKIDLDNISEDELLGVRICDLPIGISGTWLEGAIDRLHAELREAGLQFFPQCYLANEWLIPDDEPVIGIPFFLAHPALIRLEKRIMLEAEGETRDWCMKLLRHEAGHAINYAYKLHKRLKWKKVFGPISKEYGDTYKFRPYSRNFVKHLEDYYAQYHPDEDFSETFAVWLTPESNWGERYKNWRAIKKLNYVNELMFKIKDTPPPKKTGRCYWQISQLRITLANYYKKKKRFHVEDFPDFHDVNLKRIFAEKSDAQDYSLTAYSLIKSHRKNVIKSISAWTGEKKYVIDDILKQLTRRVKELNLVVVNAESLAMLEFSTYLTTLVMNYSYTGKLRGDR